MDNVLIRPDEFVNNKFTEKDSFIMLPTAIAKNVDYVHWRKSARGAIAEYLLCFIIRGKSQNLIQNEIFKKLYLGEQRLITRFSEEELAKRLNYRDKKSIVGYLNTLENEGIFKVIYFGWGKSKIKLYELGFYECVGPRNYSETIYAYQKFFALEQLERATKFRN